MTINNNCDEIGCPGKIVYKGSNIWECDLCSKSFGIHDIVRIRTNKKPAQDPEDGTFESASHFDGLEDYY